MAEVERSRRDSPLRRRRSPSPRRRRSRSRSPRSGRLDISYQAITSNGIFHFCNLDEMPWHSQFYFTRFRSPPRRRSPRRRSPSPIRRRRSPSPRMRRRRSPTPPRRRRSPSPVRYVPTPLYHAS